jgi:hypothetical protein
MKRLMSSLLLLFALFAIVPLTNAESAEIEYLPDGSYYITEIRYEPQLGVISRSNTKTFTKSSSYYNSNGIIQWTMVLHGSFTYDGVTSTCTDSWVTYSISNNSWHYSSSSASKSGNTASGSLTMIRVVAGITVDTKTKSLTLSCDKDGNPS